MARAAWQTATMLDAIPSRTAAFVAAARSFGALLPAAARLIDDPYGQRFAARGRFEPTPPALAVRHVAPLRSWVLYMQVRTRVLDDALARFVAEGGRQVVLLGAGYDARALRFAELLRDSRVFEVDHPTTQSHKRRVLARGGLSAPAVRYVTWDFEERPLAELGAALGAAGHDPVQPTLTIWEGVTMYLTPRAIDASVRAIRGWSGPGSALAITYVTRDAIDRPGLTVRATRAMVRAIGEPWRFGWNPGELAPYLGARGFALRSDASIADEAVRLLPPRFARGVGRLGQRIAVGTSGESIAVAAAT